MPLAPEGGSGSTPGGTGVLPHALHTHAAITSGPASPACCQLRVTEVAAACHSGSVCPASGKGPGQLAVVPGQGQLPWPEACRQGCSAFPSQAERCPHGARYQGTVRDRVVGAGHPRTLHICI